MLPMLASDYEESKIVFPVMVQLKVDGVRGITTEGYLTGRSLKKHKNIYTTEKFSHPKYAHMDGEMIVGNNPNAQDLCRATTSALNRIKEEPVITWYVFDYLHPSLIQLPYEERYAHLVEHVELMKGLGHFGEEIQVVESTICHTIEQLLEMDTKHLAMGGEGSILRSPKGLHKQGRSTVKEAGLLRIKRFVDEEAIVLGISEGQKNNNVAKTDERGYTERSTHKENMEPNGQVGTIHAKSLLTGTLLDISPGKMTQEECLYYFEHPEEFIGQTVKFSHFPRGRKGDNYRFPTFQCFRMTSDISEG